jgi:hypothetical protein
MKIASFRGRGRTRRAASVGVGVSEGVSEFDQRVAICGWRGRGRERERGRGRPAYRGLRLAWAWASGPRFTYRARRAIERYFLRLDPASPTAQITGYGPIRRVIGHAFFVASLIACGCMGIYFGLFSCGNYAWKKELAERVSLILVLLAFLWPTTFLRPWWRRLLFPPTMFLFFRLVQGVASCFYPSLSDTWHGLWQDLIFGIREGPC